jgi:hypothetical protein
MHTQLMAQCVSVSQAFSKTAYCRSSSKDKTYCPHFLWIKPVWTYGIELWGCATKSNITVIQRYQSKLLRTITTAPRYVSNQTLHSDLHIPHVSTIFRERTATHHTTLDSHPKPLMEPLVHPPNRRLKRRWTFDEIH